MIKNNKIDTYDVYNNKYTTDINNLDLSVHIYGIVVENEKILILPQYDGYVLYPYFLLFVKSMKMLYFRIEGFFMNKSIALLLFICTVLSCAPMSAFAA